MIPRTSRRIASFALRLEKGSALDLGCGSGYIGNALSLRGFKVDCADSDKNALSFAKKNLPNKINFYSSDLFNSIPGKKYDLITFDIPFFPEKKNTGKKAVGNFITLLHLESFILPLLRKAFPDKNRKRRDFIARVAKESRAFLRPGGNLIIDIFEDEFPAVSEYLRINKKEEMFRNHFIICASLKDKF